MEELNAAFVISAKWLTLPFLVISLLAYRRKDHAKLWQYCLSQCFIISACVIFSVDGVVAFNKHVGESRAMTISGYIVKTNKPGSRGRYEVVLRTPDGLVTINILSYLFEKNKDGDHFSMDCRVGSLGLVFL